MQNYSLEKVVGEGSFGKALLCRRKSDSKRCIIKQIALGKLSKKDIKATEQESALLSKLQHPNIVSFWEAFHGRNSRGAPILCIVMEYADGGDLALLIKNRRGRYMSESQVLQIFVQICLAMKHVHDRKILHRDLKSQNIFMTSSGVVKLGDFGIAKILRNTGELASTQIGTPYFMSPEILQNVRYNNKSDIWSLGCVLFELMCLKVPFDGSSMKHLVNNIINQPLPPTPSTYSAALKTLLQSMLAKNHKQRPSVNTILHNPIVRDKISSFLHHTLAQKEFSHTVLHGNYILASKDGPPQPPQVAGLGGAVRVGAPPVAPPAAPMNLLGRAPAPVPSEFDRLRAEAAALRQRAEEDVRRRRAAEAAREKEKAALLEAKKKQQRDAEILAREKERLRLKRIEAEKRALEEKRREQEARERASAAAAERLAEKNRLRRAEKERLRDRPWRENMAVGGAVVGVPRKKEPKEIKPPVRKKDMVFDLDSDKVPDISDQSSSSSDTTDLQLQHQQRDANRAKEKERVKPAVNNQWFSNLEQQMGQLKQQVGDMKGALSPKRPQIPEKLTSDEISSAVEDTEEATLSPAPVVDKDNWFGNLEDQMGALKNQMQNIREKKRSPVPAEPSPPPSQPIKNQVSRPSAAAPASASMSVRGKALPHKKQTNQPPKLHVRPPVVDVSASEALEARKQKREADRRALRHYIQQQRGVASEASSSPSVSDISRSPQSISPSTPQYQVQRKNASKLNKQQVNRARSNRPSSSDVDSVGKVSRDGDSVTTESSVDRAKRMREQRDAERAELRKLIAEQRRQHRAEKSPAPDSASSCNQEAFPIEADDSTDNISPSARLVMTAIMEEESNSTCRSERIETFITESVEPAAEETDQDRKVQFKDFLGQTYTPINSDENAATSEVPALQPEEQKNKAAKSIGQRHEVNPTLLEMGRGDCSLEDADDACCGALYGFFRRDEKVHPKSSPVKAKMEEDRDTPASDDNTGTGANNTPEVDECGAVEDVISSQEVEASVIYGEDGEDDDNELMMSITLDETEYNQMVSVMQEAMESLTEVMNDEDEEFGDESTSTEEMHDADEEDEEDGIGDAYEMEEDSIGDDTDLQEEDLIGLEQDSTLAAKRAAKPLAHYLKEEAHAPPIPQSQAGDNYKDLLSSLPMDAAGMVKELEGLLAPQDAVAVDISYADTIRNEARLPHAVRESMDNEDACSNGDWSAEEWENEENKNLTVYGVPMMLSDAIAIDDDDTPATKIEAIREYLEEKLGLEPFVKAYRFLKSIHEMHEDDELLLMEMEAIVGADGLQYIDTFFQLLTIEDKFES